MQSCRASPASQAGALYPVHLVVRPIRPHGVHVAVHVQLAEKVPSAAKAGALPHSNKAFWQTESQTVLIRVRICRVGEVCQSRPVSKKSRAEVLQRLRGPLPGPRWRLRARALRGNPLCAVAFFPSRSGTGPQRCSVAHLCGPAAPQFILTTKSCEREGMTQGSAITSRAIVTGATSR